MRSQDTLEERLAHPVVDVGVDAAEGDEELVLDVDVVLGAADQVHVGLLDRILCVFDAGRPLGGAADDLRAGQVRSGQMMTADHWEALRTI